MGALHGRVEVGEKQVAKSGEILFAIEMLKSVLASGSTKRSESRARVVDELYSGHKILQGARAIEKTVLAIEDQLRDASDRGGEHWLAANHGFHQDQRDTFTAAG